MASAGTITPDLPDDVCGRVWLEARCFYSRESAQSRCWLWLLRADGRIDAVHMPARHLHDDARLQAFVRELDAHTKETPFDSGAFGDIVRLKDAPAVPMPRWAISWGHPTQKRLRAFAAQLDQTILRLLGDLEAPGPFLGSVDNYNRLAKLPTDVRERRMQALADFPPLVVPLLLRTHGWPSLLPDQYEEDRAPAPKRPSCPHAVLQAIDQGRDLVGALAAHYRVSRALVRSMPMRSPWACLDGVRDVARLLDVIPAHARPKTLAALETWWPAAQALPFRAEDPQSLTVLGQVFAKGWDATWESTGLSAQQAPFQLRDCRDFLAAAAREVPDTDPFRDIDVAALGTAWLARRGLCSLVSASTRWHAQAMVPSAPPGSAPAAALPAIIDDWTDDGRRAIERLTAAALVAEGQAMAHCVGDYWHRCEHDGDRILRLSLGDGEQATAHFVMAGIDVDGPRYVLEEVRGSANVASSPGMWSWAERVEKELNAPKREDARRRAFSHLRDCARHAAACAPGWVRPFDRNSRRELGQVLEWLRRQGDTAMQHGTMLEDQVAGVGYAPAFDHLDEIAVGDALALMREPANPHDPNAIRIEWSGRKLGYVPRRSNARLAQMLDRQVAVEARLTQIAHTECGWPVIGFRVRRLDIDNVASPRGGSCLMA